jgi:hypothetical protein
MRKLITKDGCILEPICRGVYRVEFGVHHEQKPDGIVLLDDESGWVRCWNYTSLVRRGDKRKARKMSDPMNGVFFEQVLRDIVLERGYASVLGTNYFKLRKK